MDWIVDIDRSARDVFALISDPTRDMEWKRGVRSCVAVGGEDGTPLDHYELLHRPIPLAGLVTTRIEVLASDAPRSIVAKQSDRLAEAHVRYELVAAGGRTHFIQQRQVSWHLSSFLKPVAGQMLWRAVHGQMWGLKRLLESPEE